MRKTKRGTLLNFDKTATHDYFVGNDVINVTLQAEAGEIITARYIPSRGAHIGMDILDFWQEPEEIRAIDDEAQTSAGNKYANEDLRPLVSDRQQQMYDCHVRPAIGDTLSISWDYGSCCVVIETLAHDRRHLIPWQIEAVDSRSHHAGDVLDSFIPGQNNE